MFRRRCRVMQIVALAVTILALLSPAFGEQHVNDESWYMERHYRHAHSSSMPVANKTMVHDSVVKNIRWAGVTGCKNNTAPVKQHGETTDDVLPRSSICPWNWVINYDPRRTPSMLLVAHCACRRCLYRRSTGNTCQPVIYFRPVTYFKGTVNEVKKLYRLAVGCTCERAAKK